MSERKEQAASPADADEVAAVVGRASEAARAIEHYTQEQVDELVTAMAWAVVRKDHAEAWPGSRWTRAGSATTRTRSPRSASG